MALETTSPRTPAECRPLNPIPTVSAPGLAFTGESGGMGSMILTVPVNPDGQIGTSFGKAVTMAVATVTDGRISHWQLHEVGWDVLHDQGEHGQHHGRIVRFLKENGVERVMFVNMGSSMMHTINKMGLQLVQVGPMDAREAVIQAAALVAG